MKDAHYCAYILTVKEGKTLWGNHFHTYTFNSRFSLLQQFKRDCILAVQPFFKAKVDGF